MDLLPNVSQAPCQDKGLNHGESWWRRVIAYLTDWETELFVIIANWPAKLEIINDNIVMISTKIRPPPGNNKLGR